MALEIEEHNFVGYFSPEDCSIARFRPWIVFLNEHSIIKDAIRANVQLKNQPLMQICSTFSLSHDAKSFSFSVGDTVYTVDESVINTALNLPKDNFIDLPDDNMLVQFFQHINYQGTVELPKLTKSEVVSEWDVFFDTISKVFSNSTKRNFHVISSLIQYIGYVVAHNQRVNIGRLLFNVMMRSLVIAKQDFDLGQKIFCYYPRFLMLIFNNLVYREQQALFVNSPFVMSNTTHKKYYTCLGTASKFPGVLVVITRYMFTYIHANAIMPDPVNIPLAVGAIEPSNTQVAPPVLVPAPLSGIDRLRISNPGISYVETSMGIQTQGATRETDQGIVQPQQSLTQVIKPNTSVSNPSQTPKPRKKLAIKRKKT